MDFIELEKILELNFLQLIVVVNKIFLKIPSRVENQKEMYTNLCLPPEQIITRWTTWLNVVKYYCENFEKNKRGSVNVSSLLQQFLFKM